MAVRTTYPILWSVRVRQKTAALKAEDADFVMFLEDLEPRRMMAMRPSRQGLNGVPGMEDLWVEAVDEK